MKDVIVSAENIKKYYPVRGGLSTFFSTHHAKTLKAVENVSFQLGRGESLGIVGESGCGKSSLAKCLMALQPVTSGKLVLFGEDISQQSPKDLRTLRSKFQMIFQDPYSSLNPRRTVYETLVEPLVLHKNLKNKKDVDAEIFKLLEKVGLSRRVLSKYPHEFSGGQRQRIAIARAIAPEPELLVCDEPVSALDVSIQAQILNLLNGLRKEMNLAMIFIAHDLSVVRYACETIAVMYLGKIVEVGSRKEIFEHPAHPYTQALIAAAPLPDPILEAARTKNIISGDLPSPIDPPSGCYFRTRCPIATNFCAQKSPELRKIVSGQLVSCHYAGN